MKGMVLAIRPGAEHTNEGVTRRISTSDRPKLIGRQGGLPVARVAPALPEIHVTQHADHLEFDDELVHGEEFGGEFANQNVVAGDDDAPLHFLGSWASPGQPSTQAGSSAGSLAPTAVHPLHPPLIPVIRLNSLPLRPHDA